jgi:hypothetical protein
MFYEGRGKVCHRTGHEDPEGEYRHSSTFSLTSALDVVGWSISYLAGFTPGKRAGTHFSGHVGLRRGLDGCGKSRLKLD